MPKNKKYRSSDWFNSKSHRRDTFVHRGWMRNQGHPNHLFDGRPVIGICNTWSELTPCNGHFRDIAEYVRRGVYEAGGFPLEFPVFSASESNLRPTAMLFRNLASMDVEEAIRGNPIDGVVLTTGCDKTTPAALMAAATVNIPAIVLSGGPMLDGNYKGKLAGSGTIIWEARKLLGKGKINYEEFMNMVSAAAPSIGHCNTMGTASSMNSVAEALGMSLPGCAVIPAPYREREQVSFDTGKRIVGMVHEDLRPSKIMTRKAFENAVIVASAIGGSSNCTTHLIAIAKHMGVKFDLSNWQKLGHEIPLLANCQPAGEYLMESFYRAGGIPAIMKELMKNNKIHTNIITVSGKTVGENLKRKIEINRKVIKSFKDNLSENAGFLVMKGNFFSSAIMKTSVISPEFRERYLSDPNHPNVFKGKAVVFEGPEDYHKRINSKKLKIDEKSILIIRGCGPVGYPGAAEVVNMQPPDRLLKKGINALPTLGDGRQSGTSESPSILHVSPESAVGGDLAIVKTGDKMRIDLRKRRVKLLISKIEFNKRRKRKKIPKLDNQTPWQEISRLNVGQLEDGACIRSKGLYMDIAEKKGIPRNNH